MRAGMCWREVTRRHSLDEDGDEDEDEDEDG